LLDNGHDSAVTDEKSYKLIVVGLYRTPVNVCPKFEIVLFELASFGNLLKKMTSIILQTLLCKMFCKRMMPPCTEHATANSTVAQSVFDVRNALHIMRRELQEGVLSIVQRVCRPADLWRGCKI